MASPTGLELRQLRAFVTLVERGGVSAAARALALAQSTVSEALAALERAIGTELAVRRRGSYTGRLTAAGEALLPHARSILSAVDTAHAAVAGVTQRARGVVDIVANESTSTYLLPAVLADLRKQWPKTRFSVSVATCAGTRRRIAHNAADLGLLLAWQSGRRDDSIRLRDVPLVLFARSADALEQRASDRAVARAALAGFRVFVPDAAGDFHAEIQRFFTRDRLGPSAIEATGSVEGVKRAVIGEPDALGLLPDFSVAEELRLKSVVRLHVSPSLPEMRLVAQLPPRRSQHPVIDAIIDALRAPAERFRRNRPRLQSLG